MRQLHYSRQCIEQDDINSVLEVLKSDFLTQGPKVKEFEELLADYCCAKFAVTFSSGTAALHGAYFAAGLGINDQIITSPMTFLATSNAALFLGASPVFVDIEPDTGNIEHTLIEKDACHALGASYKNTVIGDCRYSDMAVFSFHPVKSITTGEGGAVLTNNKEFHNKLIMYRHHGVTKDRKILKNKSDAAGDWYYEMQYLGYNYRLTDIHSALGISQLKKLDNFVRRRREIVERYGQEFKGNTFFELPVEKSYAKSAWHLYPIRLKNKYKARKAEIFAELRERGLGVQVHYIPVHLQPYYQQLGYERGLCPNAEDFYQREISIPLHQSMNDADIDCVIDRIFETFREIA
jgi:dTDP-4-amino-4,6-dideoxygalactose transaminase